MNGFFRFVVGLPLCAPLAFAVNSATRTQSDGWVAFYAQAAVLAVIAFGWSWIAGPLSRFFAQPQEALFVLAASIILALSLSLTNPEGAALWLVATSLPLWLRNGSIAALFVWGVLTLALTAAIFMTFLFLVGFLIVPIQFAALRTTQSHLHHRRSGEARHRSSAPAVVTFLMFVGAANAVSLIAWSALRPA